MPGLVPGIHVFPRMRLGVDGRDKPGHDEWKQSTLNHFLSVMGPGFRLAFAGTTTEYWVTVLSYAAALWRASSAL
jgi:hypothetical protein